MKKRSPRAPRATPPGQVPLRVLVVEHNDADVELCLTALRRSGLPFTSEITGSREGFQALVKSGAFDIVLSDYKLPAWTGLDALADMQALGVDVPFILVTGTIGEEAAVDAIKLGATDYVLKDRIARLP